WGDSLKLTTSLLLGLFTKPAISAHPGPIVQAGGNVTLRCHPPLLLDKFMLHKKVNNGHFQRCGEVLPGGHAAADFSIGPMTSGSEGTYRCYGSLSRSPFVWSAPSDPVDIVITGSTARTCTSPMDPRSTEDLAIMDGEPQEDQAVSNEDSPAEDVIYAHLDLGTLSERLNTPTPLSPMHLFPEPSIYEEFNVMKDRDEP
ncbi:hypothetical protein G4228_020343, partial [Cervus hanglu yarkandensis]